MNSAPTHHELGGLSAACQRLWQLDGSRLQPGQHYDLNPQVFVAWEVDSAVCWLTLPKSNVNAL